MPIHTSIDANRGLITMTVRGLVSADDYLRAIQRMLNHPDSHPGLKNLTDLREAIHSLTGEDVTRIGQLMAANLDKVEGGMMAVVVSKSVAYGMGRMLQTLLDGPRFRVGVFYDIAEAERWLGITQMSPVDCR